MEATTTRRTLRWSCLVLAAGVMIVAIVAAGYVAVTLGNRQYQSPNTSVAALPSSSAAESLLVDAYNLAQAHNYVGLCQDIAQDPATCRLLLQQAQLAGAAPGNSQPVVLSARAAPGTPTSQGAEVLSIRGIRADGTVYNNHFSAVRATAGQIRSQNAVYWFSNFVSPS
jgi:hypothetical protein